MTNAKHVIIDGFDLPFSLNLTQFLYQPFRSRVTPRFRLITPMIGESMTKQAFRNECDINNILKTYANTGVITHLNTNQPSYMDLTNIDPDYLQTLNSINSASDSFLQLPALLRKKFDNDPLTFLSFVTNPANADELVNLGLATKKPEPIVAGVSPAASGSVTP